MGPFLSSAGGRLVVALVLFSLLEALQRFVRSFRDAPGVVHQLTAAIGALAFGAAAWAEGESVDNAGATAATAFLGAMGAHGGVRAWAKRIAEKRDDAGLKPPTSTLGALVLVVALALNGCAALTSGLGVALPWIRKGLDLIERVLPGFGIQSVPLAQARAACAAARVAAVAALESEDKADDDAAAQQGLEALDQLEAAIGQGGAAP